MKKKSKSIDSRLNMFLLLIGIIGGVFLISFYNLSPLLVDFRNSILGLLLEKAVIVAVICFVCFNKKNKIPKICKVILFMYPILTLALSLLGLGRISYLIMLIYAFICFGTFAYYKLKKKKEFVSVMVVGLLSFITSVFPTMMTEFVDNEFPFWIPALIIFIIVIVLSILLSIKYYKDNEYKMDIYRKKKTRSDLIAWNVVAAMMGFVIPWMLICSLNFILDTSSPTYIEFEIVDKDIDSGSRRVTTYNLELENEGNNIRIAVSEVDYYNYEIGDEILISIYEGAFNERYYFHD